MHKILASLIVFLLTASSALADLRELVPEEVLKQIAEETSGEAAKRNLDTITLQHRMRSGTQFETATRHIYDTLRDYGLDEVEFLTLPPMARRCSEHRSRGRCGTSSLHSFGKCARSEARSSVSANWVIGTPYHCRWHRTACRRM